MTSLDYQAEKYRPQYHFTPPAKWLNDPNGLVYYAGEYHLFYQYHPHDLVWGPMHWGHAVSSDLIHWRHLPIALSPDELGTIFSGSAVIDWHNTAGFGMEALVAAYTYHQETEKGTKHQSQAIAYSIDKGRTWIKYGGNPVIPIHPNEKNFRDPKIFWFEPNPAPNRKKIRAGGRSGFWILLLAVDDSIWFFRSADLKSWEKISEFGEGQGSHSGVWETPELFRLPIEDRDDHRWVLTVGLGQGAPAGGSGIQYFVGNFDGTQFVNENPADLELWADHGADFYAAQGWNDEPTARTIWIGWMNNWAYANQIPTPTWRGAMSLPRELCLRTTADGYRLVQRPIVEFQSLRRGSHNWLNEHVMAGSPNLLGQVRGECLELAAEFEIASSTATHFGFHLRQGLDERATIRYAVSEQTLAIDRTRAGESDFHAAFPAVHTQSLAPVNGKIHLHLFIDRSSIEVFGNDGLLSMTEQIFPCQISQGVELFVDSGTLAVKMLTVYNLASMYDVG